MQQVSENSSLMDFNIQFARKTRTQNHLQTYELFFTYLQYNFQTSKYLKTVATKTFPVSLIIGTKLPVLLFSHYLLIRK